MVCLVYNSTTHNFIDEAPGSRRGLQAEEFPGFNVIVADGFPLSCNHVIPQLKIHIGDYILTGDFYVLCLSNVDAISRLQWIESLDRYVEDFK